MPTYTYRRGDGSRFDIEQRITAAALTECPTTGQSVARIITTGAGVVFKGSGFYQNDYVRNGNGDATAAKAKKDDAPAATDAKPKEKPAEKSVKPAAKSE